MRVFDDGDNRDTTIVAYRLIFATSTGTMFQGDCLPLMENMAKESVDLIFADPPFNLNKVYESGICDLKNEKDYLAWTEKWVLKTRSPIKISVLLGHLILKNI